CRTRSTTSGRIPGPCAYQSLPGAASTRPPPADPGWPR
ncbi:MAG: hypothetical protein AVDCRST_MAG19-34, partial [uncultured Thermomicrobiales bacterium]